MMPYERGGRSDKSGNRYEIRVFIYHVLKLLEEKIDYIILEAIGDAEQGVDLWIGHKDGTQEGIQCKGRNGSQEFWDFGTANAKSIFSNWKKQLDRNSSINVSLASPLAFTLLEDLVDRVMKSSNNGPDFYEYQVKTASSDFVKFTSNICKVMEINKDSAIDLERLRSYLMRIRYRQISDYELKETILSKMDYLFLGNSNYVYDSLVSWIIDGELLGKVINLSVLYRFFKEKQIELKNLTFDSKIVPRIIELNKEYKMLFHPINNEMIIRKEFEECRESIMNGKSLIIHGRAGRGKSGCTVSIIDCCEEKGIRYLAIKLDKRIPSGSAEKWGIDLGFPSSIVHCMHSITKNEKAVIILDQLDSLRWTQVHSRDALLVCFQIIEQVKLLNLERSQKISIVFVSRTYDLENDNNIRGIFRLDNYGQNQIEWHKVCIGELDDEQVKDVVGEKYSGLTGKLQELLRSPSNLYIWQRLDKRNEYNECSTTDHLVKRWWEQLLKDYSTLGYNESDLIKTKENIVDQFDRLNRICIPVDIITASFSDLQYLSSNGFLVIHDSKVSFAHQSVLDSLLANKMLVQYYSKQKIPDILGSRENQTPGKRYQLQMLMQNLIDYDSQDFLDAGLQLLESESIRFSNKFVFFEVLNQVEKIDSSIYSFIINNCQNKIWSNHLLDNVIHSRIKFYSVLRDAGVIDRWYNDATKKDDALELLISVRPNYDSSDVKFIEMHALKNGEEISRFAQCFYHEINEDSDEMFDLRLKFYQNYPKFADNYINMKSMFRFCELRTIKYLLFLLENKIRNREEMIHGYENEFLHDDSEFLIQNGEQVLKLILPHLPIYSEMKPLSEWSGRFNKNSIERVCINIVKKANVAVISSNPEFVWDFINGLKGDYNDFINELILDAFVKFPTSFCDRVITYVSGNFQKIILDKTSGNSDELFLVKQVLSKHGKFCTDDSFQVLESRIFHYVSNRAKEIYSRRLEYNKQNHGSTVYWSFWGDLQYEIFRVLPEERLSNQTKQLLQVLERKYPLGTNMFSNYSSSGGSVNSPVSGKKLSENNWRNILTSKKLENMKDPKWKDKPGRVIVSSREEFARSFGSAVKDNPENMLKLVLSIEERIDEIYIDELFHGIAYSESLTNVDQLLVEKLMLKYPSSHDSGRANSICMIIEKRCSSGWSQDIIDAFLDIAVNHHDPDIGKPNVTKNNDKEMSSFNMLFTNAINCVRGQASEAIGAMLWHDTNYFYQFKETIELLISDENPAVRLSTMYILWPVYNIDRKWAADRIIKLIEDDYRLAGFHGMKDMFFLLYEEYHDHIIEIIKKIYMSDDEDLIKTGSHCLAEMYILNGEFVDEMTNAEVMSQKQAEEVLMMVMLYFNNDEYNALAKEIIYRFQNSELNLEMPISRLFYDNLVNLERDKEFLVRIMKSEVSRRIVRAFVHYIEAESRSLIAYKDIILTLSQSLVSGNISTEERMWGFDDSISKLIIGLYDEVSSSQQAEYKEISLQCLDLWDLMFENQIGSSRNLSLAMMQR